MQAIFQDLRFGLRMLTKKPGITFIAIFTLALGIGANSAIFTVINAALFKPLPYADESRLVVLREYRTDDWDSGQGVSFPNFSDWQAQSRSFESMALATLDSATFRAEGEPLRVDGAIVSADFFKTLGIEPLIGRAFRPADDAGGSSEGLNSVMLSYSGWQKHFNGNRKIIGQIITIDGNQFQIIGVTPQGIFPVQKEPVDFWATTAVNGNPLNAESANGSRNYRAYPGVIARLKPGVSLEQAQAELSAIHQRLKLQYPKALANRQVSVETLRDIFVRDARGTLWLLLGIVGAVLLIACVNVANVLLARATARQREIAIRMALGASRLKIAQQFLIESLTLALIGGAIGLLFSMWLVEGLTTLLPGDIPRLNGLSPDWRVMTFTAAAAVLTGLVCGLFPALTATRGNFADSIKDGARGATDGALKGNLRNALVVGEIAIALTLLVAAGLLLNSLLRLNQVRPGFNTENTLTMQLTLSGERYSEEMTKPDKINMFLSALTDRVKSLPGVTEVAHAQCVPLTGQENNTGFQFLSSNGSSTEKPAAQLRFVSENYFQVLGIPLIEGRAFTVRDDPQSHPVMMVNEAFVREHFGGQNPIGKKLKLGWGGDAPKEIVGIVGNVRHRSLSDSARAEMYVPQSQFGNAGITLIVRTQSSPESLTNSIKQQIRELDPELPVTEIRTLEKYRDQALALPRFNTFLLGGFALLALLLAMVGLYGVMSYGVTQRTQEIGVRMALGAQAKDVLKMVVAQGMKLVVAGLAFGLAGSILVTRLLQSWLYGISPTDPLTFAVVAMLLGLVALLASCIPARRATKVDPIVALRYE